ncbi:MAG: cell division protein ZapE [Gammaproteobacteria bacterium]|nr:cell division protein ZapE [Gammaproteobacteria bacterium]
MPLKPSAIYQEMFLQHKLVQDEAQLDLLEKFDELQTLLLKPQTLFNKKKLQGFYIFGEVGRGKTQLMDIFYKSLIFKEKHRLHFHRFMKYIHEELEKVSGKEDPLSILVKKLSKRCKVLCLDEFYVEDIADAMILSRFLDKLFSSGITLITTSNLQPEDLYEGGLHRDRFYPAIRALKNNCTIYNLKSSQDYRLRTLEHSDIHLDCNQNEANNILELNFKSLTQGEEILSGKIEILGRNLTTIKRAGGVIWFEFNSICSSPRSFQDYMEISKEFHTIFVSNIPLLSSNRDNEARRFIALVDECYERNVNLLLSSDGEIKSIYSGSKLIKPFKRTISRIKEMASKEYLSMPHLA